MTLARRQVALVAALVAGQPLPPGFDPRRVAAAREALLRKRAGEVARAWPMLAAGHGPRWAADFAGWAAGRAPAGALRDGWDFARALAAARGLTAAAGRELAEREIRWGYDGRSAPRPRRAVAVRRTGGRLLVGVAGRVVALRLPRRMVGRTAGTAGSSLWISD